MRDAEELEARGRRAPPRRLAAVLVCDNAPELRLVREWLDNWSGLGLIVAGMTHPGWDVQLTAYAARDWRANFFPVGIAHHRRRQRAVQRAAWSEQDGGEVLGTGRVHELGGGRCWHLPCGLLDIGEAASP
jgi:hypothetical protein